MKAKRSEGKKRNLTRWFAPGTTLPNGETVPMKEDSPQPAPEPPEWAKKRHDVDY